MKELPYYRFYVDEYLSGDITFEDYATQGVFKLACCYYWKSDCKMTLSKLNKRLTNAEQMLNKLIKSNIIKHNVQTDEIKINFLFEQFNPLISISEKRSKAGKQSGAKRRAMKQELNTCSTNDEQMTIYKDKDKDKDKDNNINLDFICSFSDLKTHLKNDTKILAESFCMKKHITLEQFYNKLDLFLEDQKSKNKLNRTAQEVWEHFLNTLNLEKFKNEVNITSCESCMFCKPENQKIYSEFFNKQRVQYNFDEKYDCKYYWERRSHNDTPQILRVELSKGQKA